MTASAGPALKRLHEEFGDRVAFVSLYVREAHPGDRYPQPESFEQKMEHARAYRERDGLPWPVAVDDVDGSLHRALDPKPSSVYIMDREGRVAFRALWSNDEATVRDGLQAVVDGRTPERPLSGPRDRTSTSDLKRHAWHTTTRAPRSSNSGGYFRGRGIDGSSTSSRTASWFRGLRQTQPGSGARR
jgi:hypothetical protein